MSGELSINGVVVGTCGYVEIVPKRIDTHTDIKVECGPVTLRQHVHINTDAAMEAYQKLRDEYGITATGLAKFGAELTDKGQLKDLHDQIECERTSTALLMLLAAMFGEAAAGCQA